MTCEVQASGTIELFFYGELPPGERARVQAHLSGCSDCREALEDLTVIRAALAGRPDVATPPGGDWSGFMRRLNAAVAAEQVRPAAPPAIALSAQPRVRRSLAPYLAAAAALALVTIGVTAAFRWTTPKAEPVVGIEPAPVRRSAPAVQQASLTPGPDPALMTVSGQHFERSKLVVLGLTTKSGRGDWAYERELASSLLADTRLYRFAAEERGMQPLADVMGDLELVLLQASMANEPTQASLQQLQRLIQRRDLLTRMNAY